jgi:hypothetical protein
LSLYYACWLGVLNFLQYWHSLFLHFGGGANLPTTLPITLLIISALQKSVTLDINSLRG